MRYTRYIFILFLAALSGCSVISNNEVEPTDSLVAVSTAKVLMVVGPVPTPQKQKRSQCTVCKGKGKVLTGDGLAWVECDACEPDKTIVPAPKPIEPQVHILDFNRDFTKVIEVTPHRFNEWKLRNGNIKFTDISLSKLEPRFELAVKQLVESIVADKRIVVGENSVLLSVMYDTAIIEQDVSGRQFVVALLNSQQVDGYWAARGVK